MNQDTHGFFYWLANRCSLWKQLKQVHWKFKINTMNQYTHRFCPHLSTSSPVSLKTRIVGLGIGGSPILWYTFLFEKVRSSHTLVFRWKASKRPALSRANPDTWPICTEGSGHSFTHFGASVMKQETVFRHCPC